jgi:hypothetical protein
MRLRGRGRRERGSSRFLFIYYTKRGRGSAGTLLGGVISKVSADWRDTGVSRSLHWHWQGATPK